MSLNPGEHPGFFCFMFMGYSDAILAFDSDVFKRQKTKLAI
jgi:hypothetical protein